MCVLLILVYLVDFILCLAWNMFSSVSVLCSFGLEHVKETETDMKTTSNYTFSTKILKPKTEKLNSGQLKIDKNHFLK